MDQLRVRFENGIEMTCKGPGLSIFRSCLAYVWILACHSKKACYPFGDGRLFFRYWQIGWFFVVLIRNKLYSNGLCFLGLNALPTALDRYFPNRDECDRQSPPISHFSFICVPPFLTPFISPWLNVCYWSCISCHEHVGNFKSGF